MTDEIAPCPFCGGASGREVIPGSFYVGCLNLDCDAVGPSKDTEAKAIAAWNRLAAAVNLAEVAGAVLRNIETMCGTQRNDAVVFGSLNVGQITVGMIRDAAPPAEEENGND